MVKRYIRLNEDGISVESPSDLEGRAEQPPDDEGGASAQAHLDVLCQNIPLLLANIDTVMQNKEYFFCTLPQVFASTAFYGPNGLIPLGVLLQLWRDGEMKTECPSCRGDLYIYNFGGSPLSGSNYYNGFCMGCGERRRGTSKDFSGLYQSAWDLMRKNPNDAVIEKGRQPVFSWGAGITGEATPDEVIKAKIAGTDIISLVAAIQQA